MIKKLKYIRNNIKIHKKIAHYILNMPVHFANNWSLSRVGDDSPMVLTFWLPEKIQKYAQNIKKTNKLGKKKVQVLHQHKITLQKISKSSQFEGWFVNDGTNVVTLHLNGRDYNPIYSKTADSDDENDDDYVRMTKEYIQTKEEIENIITPLPKAAIVVEEVPDEQVAQEGWVAE